MKVIFLDNDGVICLSTNWGSRLKKQKKLGNKPVFNHELPVEYRFDNFDINSRYHLSQNLEKLLIYSTLFNEYMFNITDIGYRYYVENTFFVNMLLLSVFFVMSLKPCIL
jgi:hypothetical protein